MVNVHKLLRELAGEEEKLGSTRFLAPCVRGGRVHTKVAGLGYTFTALPSDFEGWGIFQPVDVKVARLVEEAGLPQIGAYLKLFNPIRLRLAYQLAGQTWLSYPANEADVRQRLGKIEPMPVHLVAAGTQFEQTVARWDGRALWFEETDRRADPLDAERLREALHKTTPCGELRWQGMTPEMLTVYSIAAQKIAGFQKLCDEQKLRGALHLGGGDLHGFSDRGDYWLVEWVTDDGGRHTSAVAKKDLTVLSAGICLSGQDRKFDLQSLVGVIEAADA